MQPPDAFAPQIIETIQAVMCILYQIIYSIAGPLAVFMISWAAVKWVGSEDDAAERERSKQIIKFAIVSLVLIIVAKPIAELITDKTFNCAVGPSPPPGPTPATPAATPAPTP